MQNNSLFKELVEAQKKRKKGGLSSPEKAPLPKKKQLEPEVKNRKQRRKEMRKVEKKEKAKADKKVKKKVKKYKKAGWKCKTKKTKLKRHGYKGFYERAYCKKTVPD